MAGDSGSARSSLLAAGALALAALFWSGNFIAGRWIAGTIPPLELNLLRWIGCLLLFLPFVAGRLARHRADVVKSARFIALLGILGIAGFNAMVYQALTLITVVNALLILSMLPVTSVIGGAIWNRYRPTSIQVLGIVVSMGGAMFLVVFGPVSGGPVSGGTEGHFQSGFLWMITAVLAWTWYSLLLKRRPAQLPQDVTLAASIVVGILVMLPLLIFKGVEDVQFTAQSITAVFYVASFASLGGFLFWSYGVAGLGPEKAGQFIHLMPLFGTVLAVILLGERLEWVHFVGASMIVTGIVLVNHFSQSDM